MRRDGWVRRRGRDSFAAGASGREEPEAMAV